MEWTPYSTSERMSHLRLFPVVVGAATGAGLIYLITNPPGEGMGLTGGLITLGLATFFFGGLGTIDLIRELRKRRWRGASVDERDRGLVVMLGKKVSYGFGEAMRYSDVENLSWAAPLGSRVGRALVSEFRAALHESWKDYLRTAMAEVDLFRVASPREDRALIIAATLLGMAGRGELTMQQGRYVGWGRGRAKMKDLTEGTELAFLAAAESVEGVWEQALLRAVGTEHPPATLDHIAREFGDPEVEAAGDIDEIDQETRDAAMQAWSTLLAKEPELLTLTMEHVLAPQLRPDNGQADLNPPR